MQAQAGQHQIEAPGAERQQLLVGDHAKARGAPHHGAGEVGLDQAPDRRPGAERRRQLPGMAAELERQREPPPDVGQTFRQARSHLADQEVDRRQLRRRPLAPPSQQRPIEDRRAGSPVPLVPTVPLPLAPLAPLFLLIHACYMVAASSG